jgi:hypothetical protein
MENPDPIQFFRAVMDYHKKYGKNRRERAIRMYDGSNNHSIEAVKTLRSGKKIYTVRSQRTPFKSYSIDPRLPRCTCPDFIFRYKRVGPCKHIQLVNMYARSKARPLRPLKSRKRPS